MSDTELVNGLRHMADDHPCCEATILHAIDELQQLQRENTTLRDTMMRLHSECDIEARKAVAAERNNAALRNEVARLNNQTMWVCSCGGTDCAGQKENATLRKQLEQWEQSTQWFSEWAEKKQELERENAGLRKDKDRFDWLITTAPFCVLSTLSSDPVAARLKIDREMEFPTV